MFKMLSARQNEHLIFLSTYGCHFYIQYWAHDADSSADDTAAAIAAANADVDTLQWPVPRWRYKWLTGADETWRRLWLNTTDDGWYTALCQDGVKHRVSSITEDRLDSLTARWG